MVRVGHRADSLFASGIGVYILYCALRMGYGAVQALLDRALPDAERQKIIDIINAWPAFWGRITSEHDSRPYVLYTVSYRTG